MNGSSLSRLWYSVALVLLLGFLGAANVQAIECVTPLAWQPKLGDRWNLDANDNNVEDAIEGLIATSTFDIVLDLNDCPTSQDLSRFAQFGTVGYIGKSISVVQLLDVTPADAIALGQDPRVSMVEIDHVATVLLDVSNPAIRVRASGVYSPNTLQDQFPSLTGAGVTIAILDSGVDDGQHESLPATKFVGGFNVFNNFTEENPDDQFGHGTHVAGIALGTGGPSGVLRGIAPGAGLVDIKVIDDFGHGSTITIIAGIDHCLLRRETWGIDVINMSLRIPGFYSDGSDALSQAANRAVQAGMSVVVAAGNEGEIVPPVPLQAPSTADDVITVAASDDRGTVTRKDGTDPLMNDTIAPFSSRGPRLDDNDGDTEDEKKPEVTAPGVQIVSAQANTVSGYFSANGTSMAAPHVAGLAALLLEAQPGMRPLALKKRIIEAAEDFSTPGWDPEWGWGLVDGFKALQENCTSTDLAIAAMEARNPIIVENVPNTLRATVCNNGPNVAGSFPVRLGFYGFSNSISYYPTCTILAPAGLAPGRCTILECPWTPDFSGRKCITAEILYPCDTNNENNRVQKNLDIQPSQSPAEFSMKVVNPTGEDLDVEILTDLDPLCSGWTFNQSHTGFQLGAVACPLPISFSVTPMTGTVGSCRVVVRIEGVRQDGSRIPLGGGTLLGTVPETSKPSCSNPVLGTNSLGKRTVTMTFQDTASGLVQINVLKSQNLDVSMPVFPEGTQAPVTVIGTKIVNGQNAILELEPFDGSGNRASCDPVLLEIGRTTGAPVTLTLTDLPQAEHWVSISNGDPGITNLRLVVNGKHFQVAGLASGEVREIDLASAMLPGNENTIELTALGKPGGEAAILVHD